ncbi:tyrosinase family protein [Streptomyces sp. NPDC054887]
MTKERQDINALSAARLSDYVHALDILRARSAANPDDPTGYDFQAALHNDFFVGGCEHGSDLFLPWHRAHLHYFEKLLQEADPPRTADVTIPYWDWIHPQASGLFPAAFDETGLFSPGRNTDASTSLPTNTLEIVTTVTDPEQFGGYPQGDPNGDYGDLELGPHNDMHGRFIGGLMSDPSQAAHDPIYFSFHCFIDLMWAEWQRRNGFPAVTSPDEVLRGFQDRPRNKVAEFEKTEELDYTYAYSAQLESAFGVPVPPPSPFRNLMVAQPMAAASGADIATELRESERVQFRLPPPPEEGRRVVVRLDELKVPMTGSYLLRGFVHPDAVEFRRDDEEFTKQYGVGYVSMWRAHVHPEGGHGGHDGHGGHGGHGARPLHPTSCIVRFDVTSVLESTPGAVEDHVLTLQYIPSPFNPGGGGQQEGLIEEVKLKDVLMEVYR